MVDWTGEPGAIQRIQQVNTLSIPTFAGTGGWTVGRQDGYRCFNRVDAVSLTPEQQTLVLKVAMTTYRPFCDNSTFVQDCNHGSALLGLLELAAAQSATQDKLYRLALIANYYWFPDSYAKTALYFSHYYRKDQDRQRHPGRHQTLLPPHSRG